MLWCAVGCRAGWVALPADCGPRGSCSEGWGGAHWGACKLVRCCPACGQAMTRHGGGVHGEGFQWDGPGSGGFFGWAICRT